MSSDAQVSNLIQSTSEERDTERSTPGDVQIINFVQLLREHRCASETTDPATSRDAQVLKLTQLLRERNGLEITKPPPGPGTWVSGRAITVAAAHTFIKMAQPERPDLYLSPAYLAPRVIAWLRRLEKEKGFFFPSCHFMRIDKVRIGEEFGFILTYLSVSPRLGPTIHVMDRPLQQRLEELIGISNDEIKWIFDAECVDFRAFVGEAAGGINMETSTYNTYYSRGCNSSGPMARISWTASDVASRAICAKAASDSSIRTFANILANTSRNHGQQSASPILELFARFYIPGFLRSRVPQDGFLGHLAILACGVAGPSPKTAGGCCENKCFDLSAIIVSPGSFDMAYCVNAVLLIDLFSSKSITGGSSTPSKCAIKMATGDDKVPDTAVQCCASAVRRVLTATKLLYEPYFILWP
ncbi:hypothetical protein GGX14DRAFT_407949 [Mycena pura]|uniref:Uncharacterized protein n=1 Tax=Mycena pura TaxID=153505 RepID=A0AAD6UMJ6_9AGAR|nr:hypothetical protein GGX14DRAFT_407949 [Mycena pura]